MKRFWAAMGACMALLVVMYAVLSPLRIPLFEDPIASMRDRPLASALLGFSLLTVDILLPVPSSLIMIGLGAIHGLAGGAAISFAGTLASTILGLLLGRMGKPAFYRGLDELDKLRSLQILERWGSLAIVVSRPVPLLAETVALAAGASGVSLRSAIPAAAMGCVPPAVLYAWAGSAGTRGAGAGVFVAAMAASGILFIAGRRLLDRPKVLQNASQIRE